MFIQLINFFQKHKQILLYLFFGVCTTLINTVAYALLYEYWEIANVASTILAWLAAVLFAFVTNKRFVFESRRKNLREQLLEFVSFFGCRIATGVLDVVIMYIAVDCMQWNSVVWKLISNIVVTVINYVASKLLIFRGSEEK